MQKLSDNGRTGCDLHICTILPNLRGLFTIPSPREQKIPLWEILWNDNLVDNGIVMKPTTHTGVIAVPKAMYVWDGLWKCQIIADIDHTMVLLAILWCIGTRLRSALWERQARPFAALRVRACGQLDHWDLSARAIDVVNHRLSPANFNGVRWKHASFTVPGSFLQSR